MSDLIFQTINNFLKELLTAKNVWVGFSGGVDSHVLLYVLTEIRKIYPKLIIKAVHVNHGLLELENSWTEHCRKTCSDLNVYCKVIYIDDKYIKGDSFESFAREVRYKAFSKLLLKGDLLLVAHHLDDQAETCLLQFLRGSGVRGLSAMPSMTNFAKGKLIRPFLSITRKDILNYAQNNKLQWFEDDSNNDHRFVRNFLRHNVVPLLKNRWANISKTIARVSNHCFEADQLLKEIAEQDIVFARGSVNYTLSISKLIQLSRSRQKNVLRFWIDSLGFPLPSTIKLEHLLKDVIYAKPDSKSIVSWKSTEIRRYKDDIYLMKPLLLNDPNIVLSWNLEKPLKLPKDLGTLICKRVIGEGIKETDKPVIIRFRCGGEKCRLRYKSKIRSLKKLFQEWNVPTWKRDKIPLIFIENKLAAIVGFDICDEFKAKNNENGLIIDTLG